MDSTYWKIRAVGMTANAAEVRTRPVGRRLERRVGGLRVGGWGTESGASIESSADASFWPKRVARSFLRVRSAWRAEGGRRDGGK